MLKILRGQGKLDIVGADIVEVTPAYDTPGGDTAFVASSIVYEILTDMVKFEESRPVGSENKSGRDCLVKQEL